MRNFHKNTINWRYNYLQTTETPPPVAGRGAGSLEDQGQVQIAALLCRPGVRVAPGLGLLIILVGAKNVYKISHYLYSASSLFVQLLAGPSLGPAW